MSEGRLDNASAELALLASKFTECRMGRPSNLALYDDLAAMLVCLFKPGYPILFPPASDSSVGRPLTGPVW